MVSRSLDNCTQRIYPMVEHASLKPPRKDPKPRTRMAILKVSVTGEIDQPKAVLSGMENTLQA